MLYYWIFQITSLLSLSISALPVQNIQLKSDDVSPTVHYDPCSTEVYHSGSQWPDGIIPYRFNPNVPDSLRSAVYVALQAVENASCAQFLPQTVQSDYVHVHYGERCCSYTGKVGNGQQLLYVSEICINENDTLSDTITKVTGVIADNECESICGGSILVDPSTYGVIESPGSGRYPPNKDCLWKLWLSENETLQLKFIEFDLEQDEQCNYDYLNIIEEDSIGNLLSNTKLCGSHLISMNSTASVVSIHFHSDSYIEAGGFKLMYFLHDVLCTVNNGGCSQICISDEQGYKTGCGCYAGYELSDDEISCQDINECRAKICHQRCKNTYGSYYCHCHQGYGLSADLKTCIKCGGNYNTSSAVISSPRYPSNYPPYQNCLWTITIWSGHYLNITIKHLEISETNRCSLHYFRPAHGNFRYKRRLCGTQTSIQYILHKKSNTSFRFVSKANIASQQRTGFELAYEQVPIALLTPVQLDTVYINGNPIPYSSHPWF